MFDFDQFGHALMVLSAGLVILAFVMRRHPRKR